MSVLNSPILKQIKEKYIVDLLKEMISIPSIIGQEADLAEFLSGELNKLGFKTRLDFVEMGRPNILGLLKTGRKNPASNV